MAEVFISYSRKDKSLVSAIHDALHQVGRDTWVDWQGIPPTTEWLTEIRAAIESADNFLFVLSPDSVASQTCNIELEHAVKHRKRLIPVLARETEKMPASLAALNWVFFRDSDNFESSFKSLIDALDTDFEWVRSHTRLLVRARQWESKGRGDAFLVRGSDLRDAETWLGGGGASESLPTALHAEFITASRKAATRRLRFLAGGVAFALVVAVVLAVVAFGQSRIAEKNRKEAVENATKAEASAAEAKRNADEAVRNANTAEVRRREAEEQRRQAEEQRKIAIEQRDAARSRELLTTSVLTLRSDPEVSVQLALEASRIKPTPQAEQTLREALLQHHLVRVFDGSEPVNLVSFSPDGRLLAGASGTVIRIWQRDSGKLRFELHGHSGTVKRLQFDPSGKRLITAGDFAARIWDMQTGARLSELRNEDMQFVVDAQFSPDGRFAVTANWDDDKEERSNARVWDLASGRVIAVLQGHKSVLTSAAFSSDGTRVITASLDETARVWELPKGELKFVLAGHNQQLSAAAFSPDGKRIVTASWDHTARIWDSATGKLVVVLAGHADPVVAAVFAPDSLRVATASRDGTARVWNARNGALLSELRGHNGPVNSIAFSPDAQWLITTSDDGTARLWEANTPGAKQAMDPDMFLETKQTAWRTIAVLAGHTGPIPKAAFSPDGFVATASADGTVRLWQPQLPKPSAAVAVTTSNGLGVDRVDFSPDGQYLLASRVIGITPTVWTWSIDRRQFVADQAMSVQFNSKGSLAAISSEKETRIWDTHSWSPIATISGGAARFSPDDQWLITQGSYWTRVWRAGSWKSVAELGGIRGAFDDTGHRLATIDRGLATVWTVHGGSWTRDSPAMIVEAFANQITFVNGNLILTAGDNDAGLRDIQSRHVLGRFPAGLLTSDKHLLISQKGGLSVWDTLRGIELTEIERPSDRSLSNVVVSPNGRLIAAADNNIVWVWEIGTWRTAATLRGHLATVTDVQFSPDSRLVATAAEDKTARVWDIASSRPIAEMRDQASPLRSVAFSLDGKRLVTLDEESMARVYTCDVCGPLAELTQLAKTRLSRALTPVQRADYLQEKDSAIPDAKQLVAKAREVAANGNVDAATAIFKQALRQGADLRMDPGPWARSIASDTLIAKARLQAEWLDLDQASKTLAAAKAIEPVLTNAALQAGKLAARGLLDKAQALARDGRLKESIAMVRRAMQYDSSSKIDPQKQVAAWAAEPYWRTANEQAADWDFDGARKNLGKAHDLDPAGVPDPEKNLAGLIDEAVRRAIGNLNTGSVDGARRALKSIAANRLLIPRISDDTWNEICWKLALDSNPAEALDACERSVAMDPKEIQYRDSRGVARARTGDLTGAASDFEAFISVTTMPLKKARRQRWLAAVRAGRDPFTESEIKAAISPPSDEAFEVEVR